MVVVGGGRESDYSVRPCPLLQFLQFFQFMSDRLCQVMSGYVRLRQFTLEGWDVELDPEALGLVYSIDLNTKSSDLNSFSLSQIN